MSRVTRKIREERLALGLCTQCGKEPIFEPENGYRTCAACRDEMRKASARQREREAYRRARAKEAANAEREAARADRAVNANCAECAWKKQVAENRFVCLSAFGTCLKRRETYIRKDAENGAEGYEDSGRAEAL